jgi:hypothetical protein
MVIEVHSLIPGKPVIQVRQKNGKFTYHNIKDSVNGYIQKCTEEGKTAKRINEVANRFGILKINEQDGN